MDLASFGTGCLACGEDDDHANLLLCEGCNAENHTYCLSPPLRSVPIGDWFCTQCKTPSFVDDGLDRLVSALAPSFTLRYGEICWAQGGVGFGWWPSFIYDPRLTVGNARQLARKNLGKRHLIYFFECHDAPFACLTDSKITAWEDGLIEEYHSGKMAKANGRVRTQLFQHALQAANVEAGKPIEMRMEFNHTDQPQILPSPKVVNPKYTTAQRRKNSRANGTKRDSLEIPPPVSGSFCTSKKRRHEVRGFSFLPKHVSVPCQGQVSSKRNLSRAIESLAIESTGTPIELFEDGEFYCKLLKKEESARDEESQQKLTNIGFIKLPSMKTSTFLDARKAIQEELVSDCLLQGNEWRFFVPSLGPMSSKQEALLGPVFPLLLRASGRTRYGKGHLLRPLKVFLVNSTSVQGTACLKNSTGVKV